MITKNKYRILIWLVIILLATNLSMIISFAYHRSREIKLIEEVAKTKIEVPAQQRTRFFREQLNLRPDQMESFRDLNREFNRTAWQINRRLNILRIDMVQELGKNNPDDKRLASIAGNIGSLHTELKNVTINYYLEMKEICDEQQKQKLYEIFMSMLKENENVRLPQGGWRHRNNRR